MKVEAPTGASGPVSLRGRLLTALPDSSVRFHDDGLLVFEPGGRILHAGRPERRWASVEEIGGSPRALLLSPLWDAHAHLPQLAIAGRYHEPLLRWLDRRVFPEEARHRQRSVAREGARAFFDALRDAGTVGAGVFTAPSAWSVREALAEAKRRRVPMRIGVPLMDRGPSALVRPVARWTQLLERLLAADEATAIAPRYLLSCSERLLAEASRIASRSAAPVMTHISENVDEVRAVAARFGGESYAGVYDRFGLLGPQTLLAHGVHLSQPEMRLLRRRRSVLVHCPTSNEALGSGRMPLEEVRRARVRWCLASDIGAGAEPSMLHVMAAFLRVHRGRAGTTPEEAYYRASLAGAQALGFGGARGALLRGRLADVLHVPELSGRERTAAGVLRGLIEAGRSKGWRHPLGTLYVAGLAL